MDLATGSGLPWDKPDPRCQMPPGFEDFDVSNGGCNCGCRDHSDAGDRLQSQTDLAGAVRYSNGVLDRLYACLHIVDLAHDQLDAAADRIGEDRWGRALGKRMQLRDAPDSLGRDQSELSELATQRVDQRCTLTDQQLSCPM